MAPAAIAATPAQQEGNLSALETYQRALVDEQGLSGDAAKEKISELFSEVRNNLAEVFQNTRDNPDDLNIRSRGQELFFKGYRAVAIGARLGGTELQTATHQFLHILNRGLEWKGGRAFDIPAPVDEHIIGILLDTNNDTNVISRDDKRLLQGQRGFLNLTKLNKAETGIQQLDVVLNETNLETDNLVVAANLVRQIYLYYMRNAQQAFLENEAKDKDPVFLENAKIVDKWVKIARGYIDAPNFENFQDKGSFQKNANITEGPLVQALQNQSVLQSVIESFRSDVQSGQGSLNALPLFNRAATILLAMRGNEEDFQLVMENMLTAAKHAIPTDKKLLNGSFNESLSILFSAWAEQRLGQTNGGVGWQRLHEVQTAQSAIHKHGRTDFDFFFKHVLRLLGAASDSYHI